MADELPVVEIAPTVVISNSETDNNNGTDNGQISDNGSGSHSSDEPAQPIGDGISPATEQVAIAAIEAERDVALAEIHSDVERERIAVEAERVEATVDLNEELNKCREEIAALTAKVETLENTLIPPQPLAIVETEELPIVQESDLIQPDTAAPTVETLTEPGEESVAESLEEIPAKVRRTFRAI